MRKKKRLIARAMMVLLLGCLISAEAGAAETGGAESGARFEFTPGGGELESVPIVDPEAPEYSIEPDEDEHGNSGVTGNTAALRVDYVSNFRFGTQPVSSREQEFHAELISADAEHTADGRIEVPAFVQVTDLRGTARGWTLSVRQDDYFTVSSGGHEGLAMTGARLRLSNIMTNTAQLDDHAEVASEEIVFDAIGEYHNLMTAFRGQGTGTHVVHLGEYRQGQKDSALSSVILEIPGNVRKVTAPYQTSFTWLLADVPDTDEDDRDIGEKIDDADEGDIVDIDGHGWIVLKKDVDNRTAELLRKEIAAEMPYWEGLPIPREWEWKTSTVRSWLRNEFTETLSDEFLEMIMEVSKTTKLPTFSASSPEYVEGNETVYLLSSNEYSEYRERYPDLYKAPVEFWWLRTAGMVYGDYSEEKRWGTSYAVAGEEKGRVWGCAADADLGVRPAVTVSYK